MGSSESSEANKKKDNPLDDNSGKKPKNDKLSTEGDEEPKKNIDRPLTESDDNLSRGLEGNGKPLTEGDGNSNEGLEKPQKDDNKPSTVDNGEPEKSDDNPNEGNDKPLTEGDDNPSEGNDKPLMEGDDNPNEGNDKSLTKGDDNPNEGNDKPLTEGDNNPNEGNDKPLMEGDDNPNEGNDKSLTEGDDNPNEGNDKPLTEGDDNPNEGNDKPLTEGDDNLNEGNDKPLTEGIEGDNNFRKVYEELGYACSILRKLYNSKEPDIGPATILSETIKHAKVYSERIRPVASTTIQNIKGYTESYTQAEFEQYKEYFRDFVIEACNRNKEAEYVLKLHEEILTDLKRDWNVLALIQPSEGPAGNKFQADRDVEKSISASNKELPRLIDHLIGALSYILGFFYTLESDLNHLATSGDKPAPLTFKRLKKKAKKITEGCDAYMDYVAGLSNPQLISNDSVKQWLSMKKVSTEDQQRSLLELGEETFSGSEKVLRLLGTCAA